VLAEQPGEIALVKTAMAELRSSNDELIDTLRLTWDGQISSAFEELDDADLEQQGHWQYEDALTLLENTFRIFEAQATAAAFVAAWPRVQAAMAAPRACPQCGGPIQLTQPSIPETVTCLFCGAANQILPETLVGYYFAGASYAYAEGASIAEQCAARQFHSELHRRAERTVPAERVPVAEHLRNLAHWRELELAAATRFAQATSEFNAGPLDQDLITSRMQPCLDALAKDKHWKAAHPS
jgi:hypothetical protein